MKNLVQLLNLPLSFCVCFITYNCFPREKLFRQRSPPDVGLICVFPISHSRNSIITSLHQAGCGLIRKERESKNKTKHPAPCFSPPYYLFPILAFTFLYITF